MIVWPSRAFSISGSNSFQGNAPSTFSPLMKKVGYSKQSAGAVEAAASTGALDQSLNYSAVAKQLDRLTKMKEGKMKPELKAWLNKRLAILSQLSKKTDL